MVILVGVFQVAFGLLGLGRVVRFVSYSVMTGFLTGIAAVLIMSQLPTVLGYEAEEGNRIAQLFDLLVERRDGRMAGRVPLAKFRALQLELAQTRLDLRHLLEHALRLEREVDLVVQDVHALQIHRRRDRLPGVRVNGGTAPRLPNTSNLVFPGVRVAKLLPAMRGVAASTGSACHTKATKPSHVLAAMGLSDEHAFASVRFSLGRFTTPDEIERAVEIVAAAVESVRTEPTPA